MFLNASDGMDAVRYLPSLKAGWDFLVGGGFLARCWR
jgi:hypothetical protein